MSLRKTLTKNIVDIAQALVGLKVPGELISTNLSTAYTKVGKGNVIRLEVSADTYVAFASETGGGAVSASTSPAVKLPTGDHYVYCVDEFIRTSANVDRSELLKL